MFRISVSIVILFSVIISAQQQFATKFNVIYEWNYINFTWPSEDVYTTAIKTARYIPENIHISGVKYFEDYLYITVPRMKEGIPATLTRIPYNVVKNNMSPLLEPYPSWEMNTEEECTALQNVQNVEIDTKGLLWILDGGRTETLTKTPKNKCQARLIIYNIKSNQIVTTYTFPSDMTSNGTFLYDLVVDDTDGGYAYITDNSGPDPAIIVYSMKKGRAWIIRDDNSMKASPDAIDFIVNGTGVSAKINIASIALGPKVISHEEHDIVTQDRIVYYCPLSSYRLYSVPSAILRDEKSATTGISQFVKDLGRKASQTDGMVMDDHGILYYGLLADNSIARWDSKIPFTSNQHVITRDKVYVQWPDSLGFDMSGNLLIVTNRLQRFIYGGLNLNESNFRILQGYVGSKSYLYSGSNIEMNTQSDMMTMTSTMRTTVMSRSTPKNESNFYYETHTHKYTETVSQYQGKDNHTINSASIQERTNMIWLTLTIISLIKYIK